MDDKTLLELAAKAAGEWPSPEPFEHVINRWNPLADDGDALRLAVKLGLNVDPHPKLSAVEIWVWTLSMEQFVEKIGSDPYAATRRAIVRAAAAIGESLSGHTKGEVCIHRPDDPQGCYRVRCQLGKACAAAHPPQS